MVNLKKEVGVGSTFEGELEKEEGDFGVGFLELSDSNVSFYPWGIARIGISKNRQNSRFDPGAH